MHRILVLPLAFGLAAPALAGVVDDARLRDAAQDTGNWLSYGRDYGQQRDSPLTQINRETLGRLVSKGVYQIGTTASLSGRHVQGSTCMQPVGWPACRTIHS